MLRSLFAGVSGLRSHQSMMDVLGGNIANVNTVGYRGARMSFRDLTSQTLAGAQGTSASGDRGGINPIQIGQGAQIGAVDTLFSQGSFQTTERLMDMAIEGKGFFKLADARGIAYYTRAGNFGLDATGFIVNPTNGLRLQGLIADRTGLINPTQPPQDIKVDFSRQADAQVTQNVKFGGNLDSETQATTSSKSSSLASFQTQLMGLFDEFGRSVNLHVGDVIEFNTGNYGPTSTSLAGTEILTVETDTTLQDLVEAMQAALRTVTNSTSVAVSLNNDGSAGFATDASTPLSNLSVNVKGGSNEVLHQIFQDASDTDLQRDMDVAASGATNTRMMRQADVTSTINVFDSQGNPRALTTAFARDTRLTSATTSTLLSELHNLNGTGLDLSKVVTSPLSADTLLTRMRNAGGTSLGVNAGDVVNFAGVGVINDLGGGADINLAGLSFTVLADSTLDDLLTAITGAINAIDVDSVTAGSQSANVTASVSADGSISFTSPSNTISGMEFSTGSAPFAEFFQPSGSLTGGLNITTVGGTATTNAGTEQNSIIQFSGGQVGANTLAGLSLEVTSTSTVQDLLSAIESAIVNSGTAGTTATVSLNSDGTISITSNRAITDMKLNMYGSTNPTLLSSLFEENGTSDLDGIDIAANATATTGSIHSSNTLLNTWNYRAIVPHTSQVIPTNDTGTLVFNSDGTFQKYGTGNTIDPFLKFDPDGIGSQNDGVDELFITLDMQGLTQFRAPSTAAIRTQDGRSVGTLDSITIDPSGLITGVFTNGAAEQMAKIQLALIQNEGGMRRVGDTMFMESSNSGTPVLGNAGEGGLGTVSSGTLELSNVDLAQQFTNLIIAQRGFQANSRVITTSDEMLTEVVNMKR